MIEALQDSRRDSSCDELWNDSEDAGKSSGAAETMAQTGRRAAGGGSRSRHFRGQRVLHGVFLPGWNHVTLTQTRLVDVLLENLQKFFINSCWWKNLDVGKRYVYL